MGKSQAPQVTASPGERQGWERCSEAVRAQLEGQVKLVPVGDRTHLPGPLPKAFPWEILSPPTGNSSLTGRTLTNMSAQGSGISLVPRGLSEGLLGRAP